MTANENDERALRLLVKDAEFKADKANNLVYIVPYKLLFLFSNWLLFGYFCRKFVFFTP